MSRRSLALGLAPWLAVAMHGSGCVSSSTWSAWHDTRARIEDDALEGDEVPSARSGEASEDEPFLPSTPSCEDLVAEAVRRSPALRSPRERARAELALARSAGSLSAPSIRGTVWGFPIGDPSLADRDGMYMLGAAQELVSSDLLDAGAREHVASARASLATLSEISREVSAQAANACVDWSAAAERQRAIAAFVEVLRRAHDLVRARYGAGDQTLADLARIERELARASRAIHRAASEQERAAETLRALLDVDREVELGAPPPLQRELPELDAAALLATALRTRGVLEAAHLRVEASVARADAARAAADIPTFMVGAAYMQVPQMRAGLMLEVGMTLPWLTEARSAAADAAHAAALADEADIDAIERQLSIEVRTAVAALNSTISTLASLRAEEVPATRRALSAVEAVYISGGSTLLDWLDAARAVRELDVEETDLWAELAHRLVDVASAVGVQLPRAVSERSTETPASRGTP